MCTKSFPVIDMVATGKNIVRLRKESGLSVADLQEYFGFEAPQAIYKWQKGISLPSTDNLLALGRLLDVAMEEILVTRPTAIDIIMPQEKSCGNHRFGDLLSEGCTSPNRQLMKASSFCSGRSTAPFPGRIRRPGAAAYRLQ